MPLSLVSMTGLVAGGTATVLLPVMGFYGDRGYNPTGRRTCLVAFSALLLVTGMAVIITANMLHLSNYGTDTGVDNCTAAIPYLATDIEMENISILHSTGDDSYFLVKRNHTNNSTISSRNIYTPTVSYDLNNSAPDWTMENASEQHYPQTTAPIGLVEEQGDTDRASDVPFTAGLGMLGYILLSLAYDCITSNVKTWMLTCSPPSAPTPTLVTGLVMASLGGMLSSVLGMVDLAVVMGVSTQSQ